MNKDKETYKVIVRIPSVNQDTRIGSVFNLIFSILFQTEQTESGEDGSVLWDFSECDFLHPFFIGASAILRHKYKDLINISGCKNEIAAYLDAICFEAPLVIAPNNNSEIWSVYKNKSYLPICIFNPDDESSVKAQELIQNAIRQQLNFAISLNTVMSLLFSELIDNITEHSRSKEGYLFCQSMPRQEALYILIADTGRSIYSSYASDARYSNELSDLES